MFDQGTCEVSGIFGPNEYRSCARCRPDSARAHARTPRAATTVGRATHTPLPTHPDLGSQQQRENRAGRWIVDWRKENDFSNEEWLGSERKEVTVILGNDRFRRGD